MNLIKELNYRLQCCKKSPKYIWNNDLDVKENTIARLNSCYQYGYGDIHSLKSYYNAGMKRQQELQPCIDFIILNTTKGDILNAPIIQEYNKLTKILDKVKVFLSSF